MNKHLAFINTSKKRREVEVVVIDAKSGSPRIVKLILGAGEVLDSAAAKIKLGPDVVLQEIKIKTATGEFKSVATQALRSPEDILKKSMMLDIETTALRPGSPITQIAVTDLSTRKSNFFIPLPNFVTSPSSVETGMSWLQKISARKGAIPEGMTFRDLKLIETFISMPKQAAAKEMLMGAKTEDQITSALTNIHARVKRQRGAVEDYMIRTDKFQAKLFVQDEDKLRSAGISIDSQKRAFVNTILDGTVTEEDVTRYLRANQGVLNLTEEMAGVSLIKGRPLRDIINTDLPDLLRGKVTWIANANFESGQFGAQTRAEAYRAMDAFNASVSADKQLDEETFMRRFHMGAMKDELVALNLKRADDDQLYVRNPFISATKINPVTGKPFDVTGTGLYDITRARALKSGDFSKLYEAMLMDTHAGDVRDPMDMTRALQSKLKNIGVLDIERPTAMSVEIQTRFAMVAREMRLAEEAGREIDFDNIRQALTTKETHVAIGDTVLSEAPLLREQFDLLESLRKVEAGGEAADQLMREARAGRGGLYRALAFGSLQDYFNKAVSSGDVKLEGFDDVLFKQRAGRALLDIIEQDYTEFRKEKPGFITRKSASAEDDILTIRRTQAATYQYDRIFNREEIFKELEAIPEYGSTNKREFIEAFRQQTESFFDERGNLIDSKKRDLYTVVKPMSESADAQIRVITSRLGNITPEFFESLRTFTGISERQVPSYTVASAAEGLMDSSLRRTLGRGLIGAGILGVAFKVLDTVSKKAGTEQRSSYILPDFDQFMEAQSRFYGSKESFLAEMRKKYRVDGLQKEGLMAKIRKLATDFGSPYKGMGYSVAVLDDYKIRRERQRYEQAQFGARYFSPEGDVGFQLNRFVNSMFRKQMGMARNTESLFFGDFERISAGKYISLKGKGLIEHRASASDITIEDADTITIKRRGASRNSLSKFMGTGEQEKMTIRLAGIDAPETAHADRSAQPYAEMAKRIATELINKAKDVRIVSRQGDTTYGRQVSMVYVDGKNLNLELVRRGAAAFLPYRGKGKQQFYSSEAFEQAQDFAQQGNRGLWADPYFKAYQMISKNSGQSITFNTLVNASKVAKSENLMSVASLMNQAQREGQITAALEMQLIQTGETQRIAAKRSSRSIYSPDNLKNRWMGPDKQVFGYNSNSISSVITQLKEEITNLQQTKGSKTTAETMKVSRVSRNNLSLAKDSLATASKEYDFEQQNRIIEIRKSRIRSENRLKSMQEMQHSALGNLFNSPIAHHRM